MRKAVVIVSFLVCVTGQGQAQSRWSIQAAAVFLPEAWDFNESRETLMGGSVGIERRMWGPLAARAEGLLLHVSQDLDDAWLRGFTLGTRARLEMTRATPYIDVAVGLSNATTAVPARGTTFNYLAAVEAGIEVPFRGIEMSVGARWLHLSNNGRAGRHRNPDIQALGVVAGIGWKNVF